MQRSYPLRWLGLSLGLGLLGLQCQESLSDDCTKTLTCPENVPPVLDENCIWRYPGSNEIWAGGPVYDSATALWRWPDGKETATQTFPCVPIGIGDAGADAGNPRRCQSTPDCDVPLVCDTATSNCVECLVSADCADNVAVGDAGAAIACDQVRHECVPCVADADCSGDTPVCKADLANSSRNECVQCTGDNDCGGTEPICDLTSNECTSSCTSSEQCSGDKSVCNLATQLCVECTDSTSCSGSTSQCNVASNECVECTDDGPCTASGRVCDITSNNCVQCTGNAQCQNVPDAPLCDVDTNLCVQCLDDTQCTADASSRCNQVSHLCVGCTEDSQCEGDSLCNVERATCVQCLSGADCPSISPACETSTGRCKECLTNAECPLADSARCETTAGPTQYTCVGCLGNGDCSGGNRGLPGLCDTDPNDRVCVSCLLNGDCSVNPALSRCGNGGECSVCLVDDDCGGRFGGLQGCIPQQGCVECTESAHCTDTPGTPVCKLNDTGAAAGNAEVNTCVECASNNDCTNPAESRCVDNACVACQGNGDCSHLDPNGATTAGGLGICDVGTCVECTGPQRAACGTNVCDSLAKTCTNRPAGLAILCDDCVSDAECASTARCVPQTFAGTPIGNFCVPAAVAGNCDSQRPYFDTVSVATLDSTTPTAVCILRATTCPGLNDQTSACDVDADCGAAGVTDGVCVAVGAGNQCTTSCTSDNDCNGDCIQTACAL